MDTFILSILEESSKKEEECMSRKTKKNTNVDSNKIHKQKKTISPISKWNSILKY